MDLHTEQTTWDEVWHWTKVHVNDTAAVRRERIILKEQARYKIQTCSKSKPSFTLFSARQ